MTSLVHFFAFVQPKCHILAGGDHVNVFGVELATVNGAGVSLGSQYCSRARLCLPAMHFSVRRSGEDELCVGREAGLQRLSFCVGVTYEGMDGLSLKGVQESNHGSVGRNQDQLSVGREFHLGPIAVFFSFQLESGKGSLIVGSQVVQFDGLGVDAGGEDEAFGVESGHRTRIQFHDSLGHGNPQIPQTESLVRRTAEERIVDRRHAETRDLLRMAGEVADVFVVVEGEISDGIVQLGAGVDGSVIRVSPPDEIDAIFPAIENSPRHSAHAVVNGDGVIVGGANDGLSVGEEAERVDSTFVRAEHFGDPQTAHRVVSQMHRFFLPRCRSSNDFGFELFLRHLLIKQIKEF